MPTTERGGSLRYWPAAHPMRARVKKLDLAEYDGELIAKVPTQIGWIAKFLVWAQNFLRDR